MSIVRNYFDLITALSSLDTSITIANDIALQAPVTVGYQCSILSSAATKPKISLNYSAPQIISNIGYQDFGLTGILSATSTNLQIGTLYFFKVNGVEYNLSVSSQLTYGDLHVAVGMAMTRPMPVESAAASEGTEGGETVAEPVVLERKRVFGDDYSIDIVSGDLRVSSLRSTAVLVSSGTTTEISGSSVPCVDLLEGLGAIVKTSSLKPHVLPNPPTPGYNDLGLIGLTVSTSTGLIPGTIYVLRVNATEFDIAVVSQMTYGDLITALSKAASIDRKTTFAANFSADIVFGDLRIWSPTGIGVLVSLAEISEDEPSYVDLLRGLGVIVESGSLPLPVDPTTPIPVNPAAFTIAASSVRLMNLEFSYPGGSAIRFDGTIGGLVAPSLLDIITSGSARGFELINTRNGTFESCVSHNCGLGFDLVGSSSTVGNILGYQNFGLTGILSTTPTHLVTQRAYFFKVNGTEYQLILSQSFVIADTFATLTSMINNNSLSTDGKFAFDEDFSIDIVSGDLQVSSLKGTTVSISSGTTTSIVESTMVCLDLLVSLHVSLPLPATVAPSDDGGRKDRTHHNNFLGCIAYNDAPNGIGIKYTNANNNKFEESKVYNNVYGIVQEALSYSNSFRGEIYGNSNYGLMNSDRTSGLHVFDASSCWWGDPLGPSGAGQGDGDKTSLGVIFDNWRRNGTEPTLSYPGTREWIWAMLGYPVVKVELTDDQVTNCIDMAIKKFMYYMTPDPYYYYFDIAAGQHEVKLPVDITKDKVIQVVYQPTSDIFAQLASSGESFFLTYYMQYTGGAFLADFYIAMAYKETFERTLGIQPSYEYLTHNEMPDDPDLIMLDVNGQPILDPNNPNMFMLRAPQMRQYIRLYPAPTSYSIRMAIKVSRTPSEEEIDEEGLVWIRRYALAWSKEMLGRIRGKFASLPGPTGEITLNADSLITEAASEREELLKELISLGEPLTFTTG
jgi:hypothetical protein